jgi:hypothetical protein
MARYGYVSGARLDRTPSIRVDADGWTWVADVGGGPLRLGTSGEV